jgi:hypothetical protein
MHHHELRIRSLNASYPQEDPDPLVELVPTKQDYPGRHPSVSFRKRRTMARMIGRILLALAVLAVTGSVLLALIGFGDRYEKETKALGFSGLYERYLASQAGFPDDPKAYRAAKAERARQGAGAQETRIIEE